MAYWLTLAFVAILVADILDLIADIIVYLARD